MDPLEFFAVRFHFGGEFLNDGKKLHYLGGKEEMSFIDRDKMSLPKVIGHLKDHYNATDSVILHWLFPGKDLQTGLRALVADQACMEMCDSITDAGVADIFVENIVLNPDYQCSALELSSPEQVSKDLEGASKYFNWVREKEGANKVVKAKRSIMQEVSVQQSTPMVEEEHSSDTSDSEYLPGDEDSSENDDEVVQIRATLKDLKNKLTAGDMMVTDEEGHEVNVDNLMASNPFGTDEDDIHSDEDDDSFDETSEGELVRKERKFPRFDSNANVPSFNIGM